MKSLRVILDKHISFERKLKTACKAIHCHTGHCIISGSLLNSLAKICHKFYSLKTGLLLLLVGMSKANLHMLQSAQNTVAHVVARVKQYEHIQLVLSELYWLLVAHCINFIVPMLNFKISKSGELAYISTVICDKGETRSLRSLH